MRSNTEVDDIDQAESIRRSLARIEKSARDGRYRLIAVRVLAVVGILWFAFDNRHSATLLDVECTIVIVLGLMLGVCTERIRSTINESTLTVLQAIEESRPKGSV